MKGHWQWATLTLLAAELTGLASIGIVISERRAVEAAIEGDRARAATILNIAVAESRGRFASEVATAADAPELRAVIENEIGGGYAAPLEHVRRLLAAHRCTLYDQEGVALENAASQNKLGIEGAATRLFSAPLPINVTRNWHGAPLGLVGSQVGRAVIGALAAVGSARAPAGYLACERVIGSDLAKSVEEALGQVSLVVGVDGGPLARTVVADSVGGVTASHEGGDLARTLGDRNYVLIGTPTAWRNATAQPAWLEIHVAPVPTFALGFLAAILFATLPTLALWFGAGYRRRLRRAAAVMASGSTARDHAQRTITMNAAGIHAPDLAGLARTLVDVDTARTQSMASEVAARREVEGRAQRVTDMMKISDASLRLYCDKLAVLRKLCTRGLDRAAPDHDEQAVAARLKRIISFVRALRLNVALFELRLLDPTLRDFEDLVTRIAAAPWSRASAEALIGRLNGLAGEVGTVLDVRKRTLGGDGSTQRRDQVVASLQGQWLTSLVARTFGQLARRDGRRHLPRLYTEFQQAASAVGREDLAEYVARYDVALQDMATAVGKQMHPLTLRGDTRYLERPMMLALSDALFACLRNSLEHGLEPTHRRLEIAKEPRGHIHLESRQIAGFLVLSVRDDGRGIDPTALARRYVERGFATATQVQNIPLEEQLDWVFTPGVSLADGAKRDNGRGFGLELVRQVARSFGGDARIKSKPTKGTEVIIHIPLAESRLTTRLTLFNLVSEARATAESLAPLLASTTITVDAGPDVAPRSLVLCDRVGYVLLLEELLVAAAHRAPPNAQLRLEVMLLGGMTNVQSETLGVRLGVFDAHGAPAALTAPLPVGPEDYFGELMLECGICPVSPSPAHEVLFYLPGLPTLPLLTEPVPILALTADWQATLRSFAAVVQRTFLGIECALFGPEDIAEFRRAVQGGREAILAIDPTSLADKDRMAELGMLDGLTVVAVVADAVASLPHKRLLELSMEPIFVYGAVDEDASMLALEECLRRKVDGARLRRALGLDFDLAA